MTTQERRQEHRGTTNRWFEVNPVLLQGELGIEITDEGPFRFKIGDGTTHWNDLDYQNDFTVLSDVAFSGEYSDLLGIPTIPSTPVQVGADAAGAAANALVDAKAYADGVRTAAAHDATDKVEVESDRALGAEDVIATSVSTERARAIAAEALKADLVGGLIPTAQLPAIALTRVVVVTSQAAMLALTTASVQPGDVAARTDGAGTFMLTASDPSSLANWTLLNAPTDKVVSVNGQIGTVVLSFADVGADQSGAAAAAQAAAIAAAQAALLTHTTDHGNPHQVTKAQVGLGSVDNTPDATKPISGPQQVALDLKASLAGATFTGPVVGISKAMVGLGNVDNTADTDKPISNAQQAVLDAKADLVDGLIPTSQIPALALIKAVPVASEAAMLALTSTDVQPGDLAVRTDGAGTFILTATDTSTLASWQRLNAPTDLVSSVNGQIGTVVLGYADVGADAAGAADQALASAQSYTDNAVSSLSTDTTVVHLAGAETIAGSKTFTAGPVLVNSIGLYGKDSTGANQRIGYVTAGDIVLLGNGTLPTSIAGSTQVSLSPAGVNQLVASTAGLTFREGYNVILGTVTGTLIGTGTSQKLGFYGTGPIVQPGATTDLITALSSIGLRAAGTAVPITTTGAVAVGSLTSGTITQPTGFSWNNYNTADQTVNYERVRAYWSGNTFVLGSEVGGTATLRPIQISAGATGSVTLAAAGGTFAVSTSGLATFGRSLTSAASLFTISGAQTQSAGTLVGLAIAPTIGQTSTAGYTALLVNPTESTVGSGTRLLADFQVGGTSKLSVDVNGHLSTGGMLRVTSSGNQYNLARLSVGTGADANSGIVVRGNVTSATISNVALTSNVATITTSAVHGFTSGRRVTIAGVTPATFNGTWTISSTPTTTTFTVALVNADIASVASAGTATAVTQTANAITLQNGLGETQATFRSYDGAFLASLIYGVTTAGGTATGAYALLPTGNGPLAITQQTASSIVLQVMGTSLQSGDLQRWTDSNGTSLARVSSAGNFTSDPGADTRWYNTTDETVNYERGRAYWSANTFNVGTEFGGTGTARALTVGTPSRRINIVETASGLGFYQFPAGTSSPGAAGIAAISTWSASSGTQYPVLINPTITQTVTAGYTALLVNVGEVSTGSGARLLADFQLGSTSKLNIDTTGSVVQATGATTAWHNQTDQTTNYERLRIFWSSNVAQIGFEKGGTGSTRQLQINGAAGTLVFGGSAASSVISTASSAGSGSIQFGVQGTMSGASVTQSGLAVTPTINQTGTSGYTALLVSATETAVGSGNKLLMDLRTAAAGSLFNVDNTGTATYTGARMSSGGSALITGTRLAIGTAGDTNPGIVVRGNGTAATVSNMALTSNVATLTTSAAHGFTAGRRVAVSGVSGTFNGTFTILAVPTTTTFTYAVTAADVASTPITGTATASTQSSPLAVAQNYLGEYVFSVRGTDGAVLTNTLAGQTTGGGSAAGSYLRLSATTGPVVVQQQAAGGVVMAVQGAASQSADLQQWWDSAGNVLSKMSSAGVQTWYDQNPIVVATAGSAIGYTVQVAGTIGPGQNVFQRARGTSTTPTAVLSGDGLGALSFRGYDGTSYTGSKAFITAGANENWSATATGTNMSFQLTPNGSTTMTQVMSLSSANMTLADSMSLVFGTTTGTKIGTASTQKLAFYGATPIVQPSATPAAATDLATALTLVNDLRAKLLALGLAA